MDELKLRAAIKATEYKYFGDYEMSDDQREAVDVLVAAAEELLSLRARASTLTDNERLQEAEKG